ncbi:MAG TPA: citryl-CoA lyase [bacterium]
MEPWRTAITSVEPNKIRIRGQAVEDLMRRGNFGDTSFLLIQGRLPSAAESRVWNAILTASADHAVTPPSTMAARVIASGNRRAPEAAIAGGVLAIGDAHGGAGEDTMQMLRRGLAMMQGGRSSEEAARTLLDEYRTAGRRIPGVGHRLHTRDPRTEVLWSLAAEAGLAGPAVALMRTIAGMLSKADRPLPVNVDGALAAVLLDMGFEPAVGRIAFILGRCAGIAAHVLEELAREKPMRIEVPFVYDGP